MLMTPISLNALMKYVRSWVYQSSGYQTCRSGNSSNFIDAEHCNVILCPDVWVLQKLAHMELEIPFMLSDETTFQFQIAIVFWRTFRQGRELPCHAQQVHKGNYLEYLNDTFGKRWIGRGDSLPLPYRLDKCIHSAYIMLTSFVSPYIILKLWTLANRPCH